MCTIGAVYKETHGIAFKQCDLMQQTNFHEPVIVTGKDDIRYLKFGRVGTDGSWCGINNFGVSIVAADSYLQSSTGKTYRHLDNPSIFEAYCAAIAEHKTAKDAAAYMSEFYKGFSKPDIVLLTDSTSSYYIETYSGTISCVERKYNRNSPDNFFANTNHFRYLHGAVDYDENHSTYLRLARAESILSQPDGNPFRVLADKYYGDTVLSICRYSNLPTPKPEKAEEPYYTQASAVLASNGKKVNVAYIVNGKPDTTNFVMWSDVFASGSKPKTDIFDLPKLNEMISEF